VIELIAIAVFVSLSLITLGAVTFSKRTQATPQTRLRSLAAGASAAAAGANIEADDESNPFRMASDLVEKVGFWAQGTFKTDDNKKDKQDLAATLAHAGFRSQRAVPLYLGSRFVGIVIGIAALALFSELKGLGQNFAFGSIGALVGYYGPHYYIKRRINKRFTGIRKALPDVLDTIITCVEAGLGLNAAMDRVADERMRVRGDVMGGELKYMTYEMQAGVPREDAFHNLGERNGVDDLQALAAFMVQSEKLGTGLTEALKIYAAELRTRRRQRAQEQANKAAVKLLFPLVFFIFPTMFLVILGPAMMKFQSSFGSIAK
jgi:tight adherence protein C